MSSAPHSPSCTAGLPLLAGFWFPKPSGPEARTVCNSTSLAPPADSRTTARGNGDKIRAPGSHSRQWTEQRCTMGVAVQAVLRTRRKNYLMHFFTRFHFIVVGLLRLPPKQSYLCTFSSVPKFNPPHPLTVRGTCKELFCFSS